MKKSAAIAHLEDAYNVARDDLLNLSAEIYIYRQLYVHDNAEQKALLDDIASVFFFIVQQSLFQTMVLRLARLAEERGQGKNARLSLDHLINASRGIADSDAIRDLSELRRKFCSESKRVIPLRHKVFAHSDLQHAVTRTRSKFGVCMKEIQASYDTAAEFLNRIGSLLNKPYVAFDIPQLGLAGRDGDSLLEALRRAQRS